MTQKKTADGRDWLQRCSTWIGGREAGSDEERNQADAADTLRKLLVEHHRREFLKRFVLNDVPEAEIGDQVKADVIR